MTDALLAKQGQLASGVLHSPADKHGDDWLAMAAARTPARIFADRCGPAYRTSTQLQLRSDHAFALDSVHEEVDLNRDFTADFVASRRLFCIQSQANSKREFLLRPDLGRRLSDAAKDELARRCSHSPTVQIVVGDGLSAAAVVRQVPSLLPLLEADFQRRGWQLGQTFVVRYCRVGILNDIGDLLAPKVAVLLIGERPGLATAESLSAYLAYRPRSGHTDAHRNLLSNIHSRGVTCLNAAERIGALIEQMRNQQTSGVPIKEQLSEQALQIPVISPHSILMTCENRKQYQVIGEVNDCISGPKCENASGEN